MGAHVGGDVHCAQFVGRDQITYGYTAQDVERLIEKVLEFLSAGASFVHTVQAGAGSPLQAELDGKKLIFYPGAVQRLAFQRNERSYLLSLIVHKDYLAWATRFIPLKGQMDVRKAIEGLELPVAYSEFRPPPPGAGPQAQAATLPLEDITQALDQHVALIILGEPGCGKTTTLQKIAFETAHRLLSGQAGRVPLVVRLSGQGKLDPFEFLKTEWERRTGADFADALAFGRVLALVDGINELPRDDRSARLKAWRLFTQDYAGANQVVFTSRERDYDQALDLPRVLVEPLDDARIQDYLQRNAVESLGELLDDPRNNLRQMARNPFNLALLTYAYKINQQVMANRGALLAWFTRELFYREQKLAHPDWLPCEMQERALAGLAYAMQEQGESTTFSLAVARSAIPAGLECNGEQIPIRAGDLLRLGRAATLLDPAVEPDVRFYHQLLQEYFAALELLRRFKAGEDLQHLWRCRRLANEMPEAQVGEWDTLPEPPATGWEVTTILACGLAGEAQDLIEAIRPHNPVLAGRCLFEAGCAVPEPTLERTRADLLAEVYNPAAHLRARLQAGFALGRIGDPRFEPQVINGLRVILPQMISVPSGTYLLGSPPDDDQAFDDEKPQHPVDLPAFTIARWPVTNAEFACFMAAGGYQQECYWKTELSRRWLHGENVGGAAATWLQIWQFLQDHSDWRTQFQDTGNFSPQQLDSYAMIAGWDKAQLEEKLGQTFAAKSRRQPEYWLDERYNNPSQPVVGVTWFEAQAYCAWLSEISENVYRLPNEAEWEAAARGLPLSSRERPRIYPWGQEWNAGRANTLEGRVLKPSPVGVYAAVGGTNRSGIEDQSGNVWEWTGSLYRPYPYRPDADQPEAEGERVLRGGSWDSIRGLARCAYRNWDAPVHFNVNVGFRPVAPG